MNGTVHIDAIDRKILRVVQRQADLSQAALAEIVGTSAASCWRRLRSLDEAGVLGPLVRLLNPDAIGKSLHAVCQVRMKAHDFESRSKFEEFIASREEVVECLSMSGEWDYQLRIIAGGIVEYEDFLMKRLLTHESVSTSSTQFALKRIKYTTEISV